MRVFFWTLLAVIFASSSLADPIHDAAKSGNMAELDAAIAAGDDVNAQENRLTPLYMAVQGGHIEAVRLLLQKGADPDALAGFGYPLAAAITSGRADIVDALLKGGANPNMRRQSISALHKAAEVGCFDCVVLLVQAGADVNARTSMRSPVIHYAKSNGHQDIVEYLLSHGVNVVASPSISGLLTKADLARGMSVFGESCKGCHSTDPQLKTLEGPSLREIVGRKRGSIDGFKYSAAMRERGGSWGYDEIAAFIADPSGVIPGTTMSFTGLDGDQDRADVVLYLRSLSDNPAPMP
jgi:cytochrome c